MSVLSRIHIASAVTPLPSVQDVADAHAKKKKAVLTSIFHLKQPPPSSKLLTRFMVAVGIYHWITCLFVVFLVLSQLSGAIWDSTTTEEHVLYGQSPLLGPSQIIGDNDIPYADRVVACVGSGEFYEPKLVSSLLKTTAILEDSTGKAIHGYRVKQRRDNSDSDTLDSEAQASYAVSCGLIARTIENIFKGCLALGYSNLTLDNLRVVDDWDSEKLYFLPHTLPILIMPYWDNAPYARHAIPTWGGDSCIFRLEDAFIGTADSSEALTFHGVNQSIRHERTAQWLNRLGGVWKNGWYEDKEGIRWYSDVTSSAQREPYFMMHRVFNMQSGDELNCFNPLKCEATPSFERWGNKFSSGYQSHNVNSIYIANGTEYGLFLYESYELRIVRSVFDWETLLSNLYTGLILHRWASAQFLILKSALQGKSHWCGGGVSFVSGSKSFAMLPIMSLPRLKMTLAAFWTVGCEYEGQQGALSDTWFAIYPAIVHFTIIYYSLLNLLARALRRRVSDVLFMPTVIIFCLLHYFRLDLAQSGLLQGVDGRIETIVFSDDVDKLQLADYFTTDISWRLNGRVQLVFNVKLAILAVNLLPLCFARPFPSPFRGSALGLSGIEKALAVRVKDVGGLGTSPPYILAVVDELRANLSSSSLVNAPNRKERQKRSKLSFIVPFSGQNTRKPKPNITLNQREVVLVSSYELIRLGYLVFGENYLTTFREWAQLSALAPFRAFFHLWNHRVLVWTLHPLSTNGATEVAGGRTLESSEPQMWRLDDPRLQGVKWWQVSACSIQC